MHRALLLQPSFFNRAIQLFSWFDLWSAQRITKQLRIEVTSGRRDLIKEELISKLAQVVQVIGNVSRMS